MIKTAPPSFSAITGEKKLSRKCPIVIAGIRIIAEHAAIITIDLIGIFIFLSPYVNPTLKLSRLTANASKSRVIVCAIKLSSFLSIATLVYGRSLVMVRKSKRA